VAEKFTVNSEPVYVDPSARASDPVAEKFTLRSEPVYVDLSDSWKFQLRDAFGRWAKESGGVGGIPSAGPTKFQPKFDTQFKRVERSRTLAPHLGGKKATLGLNTVTEHGEAKWLSEDQVRHTLTMDHRSRELFFEGAGLKGSFKESETELIHRWHETTDPAVRAHIEHELDVRLKAVSLGLATVQQAAKVAEREAKRDFYKKFDAHLKKSKVGKAFLKMRDHLLSDKSFDRSDKAKESAKDYGKDWAIHLASSRCVQVLVSVAAGLAVHFAGSDAASETIRAFAENPVLEAGLGAAASIGVALAAKALRNSAKKAASKAPTVKQRLRREV